MASPVPPPTALGPTAPGADGPHGGSEGLAVVQIRELSQALEVESLPIPAPRPSSPSYHQLDGAATCSSISEKGPSSSEGEPTTAPPASPVPVARSTGAAAAAAGGGGGGVRRRLRLRATDRARQFLPGQPRVSLDPSGPAVAGTWTASLLAAASETTHPHGDNGVLDYLRREHLTSELDELLPFMKYIFVQTPSHRHIMPLHHQKAHGREITVDEHPGLHLVWYYEQIFIKPLPAYMYSQAFWTYIADADPAVYRASLGFVRSYFYLIQYEVDFDRACELKLIPKKPAAAAPVDGGPAAAAQLPTYEEFSAFLSSLARQVRDEDVSRRFRYGELRLSRINKTTMLFKGKLAYFHIHPQWGSYLSHILAPLITVFAILSVIFNALQVTLAAHEVGADSVADNWLPFIDVALYFPVGVMIVIGVIMAAGFLGVVFMGVADLVWAKSVRHRRKKGDMAAGEKSYGMVW